MKKATLTIKTKTEDGWVSVKYLDINKTYAAKKWRVGGLGACYEQSIFAHHVAKEWCRMQIGDAMISERYELYNPIEIEAFDFGE
jgi:hypothetical protein